MKQIHTPRHLRPVAFLIPFADGEGDSSKARGSVAAPELDSVLPQFDDEERTSPGEGSG